jgi:hypothetical protein
MAKFGLQRVENRNGGVGSEEVHGIVGSAAGWVGRQPSLRIRALCGIVPPAGQAAVAENTLMLAQGPQEPFLRSHVGATVHAYWTVFVHCEGGFSG